MNSDSLPQIKTLEFVLDLLFPKTCQGCGSEGSYFCLACQRKIEIPLARCFVCNNPSLMNRTHDKCRDKQFVLDGLLVAAEYENRGVRNLIWNLKYNYVRDIAPILGLLLTDFFVSNELGDYFTDCVVTFVPLHKHRQKIRGFNQAQLIAQNFALRLQLNFLQTLRRTRRSESQVALEKTERFENVRNAFSAEPTAFVAHKKILLIDDVATTGATLNQCTMVLKNMGAEEVWGLVAARN